MNYDVDYGITVLISKIVEREISDALDIALKYSHQTTFAISYYRIS